MKDPFDEKTVDVFGGAGADSEPAKRKRGRPVTTTKAEKAEQNNARQQRYRDRQKQKKLALDFAVNMIALVKQKRCRSDKTTLVEYVQYLSGVGEDQDCVVTFEDDGPDCKCKFSELVAVIAGDRAIERIY